MLIAIFWLLIYLIVAAIILEVLFWILSLVFPAPFAITSRIRGLIYAAVFVILLIYVLQDFGAISLSHPHHLR